MIRTSVAALVLGVCLPVLGLTACSKTEETAPEAAATPAAEPTPAPGAAPEADSGGATGAPSFADVVNKFDYKTQKLVWVLPEGITASGPFTAEIDIKRDGETVYQQSIPLGSEMLKAGSRPEYPDGAQVIRLSADASWPSRYQEILGVVKDIRDKYGPGHGEATFASNLKPKIDPGHRQTYCVEGKLPAITLYLETGASGKLQPLDVGGGAGQVFRSAMLAACET